MGFSLTPAPYLSDKQDTLQEHVVLVVLVHGLLIDKVPGLQIWVVWNSKEPQSSEPATRTHREPQPRAVYTHPPWGHIPPIRP